MIDIFNHDLRMRKVKKYRTAFLFANPAFLTGVGSVLNIAGRHFTFNYSDSDNEADSRALESDWSIIGQDIQNAAHKLNQKIVELAEDE